MGNKYYLIIAAAGKSERFGEDKLFLKIYGKTLLQWSISNFDGIKFEKKILVLNKVRAKDDKIKKKFKDFIIVAGGEKRAISVFNGFVAASPEKKATVIIHDGARPFVPEGLVEKLIKEIRREKGIIPVTPARETIKKIKKNYIEKTLKREDIFFVQTPYAFKAEALYKAYGLPRKLWEDLTDESQLLEILKIPVKTIKGSNQNIKITYPEDLEIIKSILKLNKSQEK